MDRRSVADGAGSLDVATRVAGAVVLTLAAVGALLLGVDIVSAAGGAERDLWRFVPVPDDPAGRVFATLALSGIFAASLVLVAWPRDPGVVIDVAGGSIAIGRRTLDALAATSFTGHPDVISATARVSAAERGVAVDCRVLLRPGTDATALRPLLEAEGAARFASLTGLTPRVRRLELTVVRVERLARHL